MLSRLTIDNYALINHLDISFPGGLVIITGQTGAGKSILLGALSLLLGGKADISVIRDRVRNCVVEAQFTRGDGELIVRRVLTPAGRSRVFVDDEPVSTAELRELALELVDIHSQNQQLLVGRKEFQLSLLDRYSGLSPQVERYNALYDEYLSAVKRLEEKKSSVERNAAQRDYLQSVYEKLDAASLVDGEMEALEEEHTLLANSESLMEGLSTVGLALAREGDSIDSRLKESLNALSKTMKYLPALKALYERIEASRVEMKDIVSEVESCAQSVRFSPDKLEVVENRMALLSDLMRRNGVSTVSELIARRDELKRMLFSAEDDAYEIETLEKEVSAMAENLREQASSLHERRASQAPLLSEKLQASIRELEMPRALFEVCVTRSEGFSRYGCDDVSFLFDANGGVPTGLEKCASGGEMSRIMLCIKALMCRYTGMPTMFFDEIDTGVSGSIADRMGRIIVGMGVSMQVFAITHLPQVACKGDAHFLVYKEGQPLPETRIKKIEGPEREEEIARLLSGENLTPEALANARVLLNGNH